MIRVSIFGLFVVVLVIAISWGIMGYQIGYEHGRETAKPMNDWYDRMDFDE